MSCQRFEEWLALDVGGDLGANESAKLQVHLGQCEACSRFAEKLRASQATLRALHGAALDEARLAVVRDAVVDELRQTAASPALAWEGLSSPAWLPPRWALAGLAAALLLAVSFWSSNAPDEVEQKPTIASIPAIESPLPEVPEDVEEQVVEARPIEATVTPLADDINPPQHQEIMRKVARAVVANPMKEKPTVPVVDSGIEVVSMPDAEAGDPDANPDVVLRLASSNPDITIYWLVGRNGD